MTLHEAIAKVLETAGKPLTAREIADSINRLGTYSRRDGAPLRPAQISARINEYPHLFSRDTSGETIKYYCCNLLVKPEESNLVYPQICTYQHDPAGETLYVMLKILIGILLICVIAGLFSFVIGMIILLFTC